MTIEIVILFPNRGSGVVIAPAGLSTPAARSLGVKVEGAAREDLSCAASGQTVTQLTPKAETIRLTYAYEASAVSYPDAMFEHRDSRYTRAADDLAADARRFSNAEDLVAYVTGLFTYGHVDKRFYEDRDAMPQLCAMTTGSCVDINAYLVAAARAAGIEAGYVTGYFIPAEKRTSTTDMHCWVATRQNGGVQHWDIAHHLKMGTRDIQPSLNPKPGVRVAVSHSMGWFVPELGMMDAKLLAEPVWILEDGSFERPALTIKLQGFDALSAAQNLERV
ncbi:MAG: transglutaminase domain-containing protein [Pseudomonadota bacterium]